MADFQCTETRHGVWLYHAESHNLFEISPEAANQISPDENGQLDRPDLGVVEIDLAALTRSGHLSDYNRRRLADATPLDGANLALNINLTAFCNLGCTYCFANGGDYGRIKGKLNPRQDVDAILNFVRRNTERGDAVRFEFFGGEPMMNFETIEALCRRSDDMAREDGLTLLFRISTNLTTRMTNRELEVFEKFGFTVSVSIDGGEKTHDRNRPNKAGRGSFCAIVDNCHKVRAQSEAITLVARMTYVPFPGSSLIDDIRELYDLNIFDWFQVLPATVSEEHLSTVFETEFDGLSQEEINGICADKIDHEYTQLANQYLGLFKPDNRFRGLLEFETIVRMILRGEVANGHCSGGRNYFTFSPDRSVMQCHRLVGEEKFQVGTFDGDFNVQETTPWRLTVNETPVCRDCAIRYICGGGCKQENFVGTRDINLPDPKKCRFQFRLATSAIQSIAHSDTTFREQERDSLKDLFVSCGRPTLRTDRPNPSPNLEELKHLRPIF